MNGLIELSSRQTYDLLSFILEGLKKPSTIYGNKHPSMTSSSCPALVSISNTPIKDIPKHYYEKLLEKITFDRRYLRSTPNKQYNTYYYTIRDDEIQVLGPCFSTGRFHHDSLRSGIIKNLTRHHIISKTDKHAFTEFFIAYILPYAISEYQQMHVLSPKILYKYVSLDMFENAGPKNIYISKLIRKNLKELDSEYHKKIDISNLIHLD